VSNHYQYVKIDQVCRLVRRISCCFIN